MNWTYKDKDIDNVTQMPENVFGFVYKIRNVTKGKSYIGRKQIFSARKKNLTKKELSLITDKRAKKYKMVTTESKWQDYTGSNKELNNDIKNGDTIEKTILHFVDSKAKLTYFETKYQFELGVIETDSWYNDNINGKYYRKIFE